MGKTRGFVGYFFSCYCKKINFGCFSSYLEIGNKIRLDYFKAPNVGPTEGQ